MDYRCDKCNMIFNGIKPYEAHMNSVKHKKKAGDVQDTSLNNSANYLGNNMNYKCEPCDMFFNGIKPYQAHINSLKHQKKAGGTPFAYNGSVQTGVVQGTSSYDLKVNKNESYRYIKETQGGFQCIACVTSLNSIEQVNSHVTGKHHEKMVCKMPQMYSEQEDSGNINMSYKCELCNMFFNGIKTYQAHINSVKHKTKAGGNPFAFCGNIQTGVVEDTSPYDSKVNKNELYRYIKETPGGFQCVACVTLLNSLGQMKSHVIGKNHQKMVGKMPQMYSEQEDPGKNLDSSFTSGFHDIEVEELMQNVKVFDIDDPVIF